MKARWLTLFVLLASFMLLLASAGRATPVVAQQPQPTPLPPPREPGVSSEPYQDANGLWMMPAGASPRAPAQAKAPRATGGPDQYGYIWDDSVMFSWIDATTGTDLGLSETTPVVTVTLPFSFKFYENTYTITYVSKYGYIGFTNVNLTSRQGRIPSPATPNNIIAPYWTPTYLQSSGPIGRVYYTSGGTAPNRYAVIQWHDVKGGPPSDTIGGDDTYRFQVILYENGDIVFQYWTMTIVGSYICGSSGIEDSIGLDGLAYGSLCYRPPSYRAVRFYRPASGARVFVNPQSTGRFTAAGATEAFQFQIRNTGDVGADTYDLTTSSSWSAALYDASGTTLLTDTDGDGMIDTGLLAQGATFTVTARINVPAGVVIGNSNTTRVTVRSSRDSNKQRTTIMQLAVPTHFAQVYRDDADGAMSLYLVQPNNQNLKKVTADWYYGYHTAVAETRDGFVYAWYKGRYVESLYVREIEYTLLDRNGNTVKAVTKLTDHSGATMSISDYSPAVAVAPNGRIGVLWYRYIWNSSTSQFNYNIWFAILDETGNVVVSPTNITNNLTWGTSSNLNVPMFFAPRIAATGDNRFVLAWLREHRESGGWVDDIYYAVRDTNGSEVKEITKLTNDTPGDSGYYDPALASLTPNRVFLSWESQSSGNDDIYYVVIGSDGNIVKGPTDLSVDETVVDWRNYDAVQLSDGKILAVWEAWGCFAGEWLPRIRIALLDTSYNRIGTPICLGRAPGTTTGDSQASVTADTAGRGILTWMDYDSSSRRNLYYALVDSNGVVLTPPVIFRTSPYIETSYAGYGNTSYRPFLLFLPLILR